MGTVWRANDTMLGRWVAVKEVRLPDDVTPERRAELLERTVREGRICAGLSHPSVIRLHDIVQEHDQPWLVMELILGRGLDRVIDEDGPLDPRRVAAIGEQLVSALEAAHSAGVLHRDVKPANVLLDAQDHAILTDFGIATREGETKLTITGKLPGAPGYVAPERMAGERMRPESDLWSLGATLYFSVEGRNPFNRSNPAAQLLAPMSEDPDPAQRAGPLAPVLEGLLRRDPDTRLRGPELVDKLHAVAAGWDTSDATPTTLDLSKLTGPRPSIRSEGVVGSTTPATSTDPPAEVRHSPVSAPQYVVRGTAGHAEASQGGQQRTPWRRYVIAFIVGVITLILAPLLVEFLSSQWF